MITILIVTGTDGPTLARDRFVMLFLFSVPLCLRGESS